MKSIKPQKHRPLTKTLGISLLLILGNIDLATNLSLSTTDAKSANDLTEQVTSAWLLHNTVPDTDANDNAGALIYFDFDSVSIDKKYYPLLHEYADALQGDFVNVVVEIAGHTDNLGDYEYNNLLSKLRAQAVKNFLSEKYQIPDHRLTVNGYGESKPIESNDTEQGRAKNRRVEVIQIGTL